MKKACPRSKFHPSVIGLLDETETCCQHIRTVAGLLGACGNVRPGEKLEAELVASAGWMIQHEVQRLSHLLNKVRHQGQV